MWMRSILCCALLLFTSITLAEQTVITIDNEDELSQTVNQLSDKNDELRQNLELQKTHLTSITNEQNNITTQISHVQNTLSTLAEQGEWLSFSTALGETLRQQLLNLPEKPKSQPLDAEIAEAKVQQLNYSTHLKALENYPTLSNPLNSSKLASQIGRASCRERV